MLRYKGQARGAQRAPGTDAPDDSPGRSGAEDHTANPEDAARSLDRIDQLVEQGQIEASVADEIRQRHRSTEDRVAKAEALALESIAEARFETVRAELVKEFPALKDEKRAQEVWEWTGRNDPEAKILKGSLGGFKKHVQDACYVTFGREIQRQARESAIRSTQDARDNMPHPPGGSSGGRRKYTPDEREDLILDAIDSSNGNKAEQERKVAMIR